MNISVIFSAYTIRR